MTVLQEKEQKISAFNQQVSNNPLSEIASGAGFVLIGTFLGMVLDYAIKVFIARFFGPPAYGIINLGLAVLGIVTAMSLIGFHTGVTRYIAYYSAEGKFNNVKSTIKSSLKIVLPVSFIFATLLFSFRHNIAMGFKKPDLELVVTIFAFIIPFSVLAEIFYASLRGLKQVKYSILSREVFSKGLILSALFTFTLFGFKFEGLALAYSLGFIGFALISFYYLKYRAFIPLDKTSVVSTNITRKLLLYSWPLMLSFVLMSTDVRIGTILLGYFRSAGEVGIYNAAFPISQIISIFLRVYLFIFLPVVSELYARDKYNELRFVYRGTSRWIFFPSSISFLTFFIFAKPILHVIFGKSFIPAADALRILALASFTNSLFGPVGALLLTAGKTKEYLLGDIGSVFTNIILGFLLIPTLGGRGAALAALASMVVSNSIRLGFAYYFLKAQPFSLNHLRFFVPAAIYSYLIYVGFRSYLETTPVLMVFIVSLLTALCFSSVVALKGLENQDLELISITEERLNKSFSLLRKLITWGIPKT